MISILLIEDSKFLRLATERALARAGYGVCCAIDGDEALTMAHDKLPDLILLDMLLPKMSGPDVLKALKKDPATKTIPVVVMTGLSKMNAAHLQEDGAFAFLEKSDLELDKGIRKTSHRPAGYFQETSVPSFPHYQRLESHSGSSSRVFPIEALLRDSSV